MAEIIAETQIPDQEKINNKETALDITNRNTTTKNCFL